MTNKEIINHAKSLIETGKKEFEKKTKKDLLFYNFDLEYDTLYTEAIKFLLDEGCIKTQNKAIQAAYFDLIPEPIEYSEQEDNFQNLFSLDSKVRIAAATIFDKLARAEAKATNRFLFSYPKTFERLMPALNDTEPKVVCNIIRALACGSQQYFQNPAIPSLLYPFLSHKDTTVLSIAIIWTTNYQDDEKYKIIIELLKQKQPQGILRQIVEHFRINTPIKYKLLAQPLLLDCLEQKISVSTQNDITKAIIKTLDEHTMSQFKSLINVKKDSELVVLLEKQMNLYESGERLAFLKRELLGEK